MTRYQLPWMCQHIANAKRVFDADTPLVVVSEEERGSVTFLAHLRGLRAAASLLATFQHVYVVPSLQNIEDFLAAHGRLTP